MAYTLVTIYKLYQEAMEDYGDPRVEDWFLMKSVTSTLLIVIAYLYIVLKCLPVFMENRKPFNIDKILIVYNILQILACGYIFYLFCKLIIPNYDYWCEPIDRTSSGLFFAEYTWWYFILKISDLLDTVFFVLRKKQSQITFLHVYHHAGMVLGTWLGTKFVPGGTTLYVGGYNLIVHVVMYTYYLLSVWDKKLKENLWWKKHLTQMQLLQFGLIAMQFTAVLFQPECKYPKWVSLILIPQNVFMVVMFGDFYYKSYVKTKKPKITESRSHTNEKVETKES